MLTGAVHSYIAFRRAAGFSLSQVEPILLDFARHARSLGESCVRTETAIDWARQSRSPARREFRLRAVIIFARHMRGEDARHEVPPCGILGPTRHRRPTPFIFTPDQIVALVCEASRLGPPRSLRPQTYATLFSLLASSGLRVSEALSLRLDDITPDGLRVRMTKFRKSRIVPLHETAAAGLGRYLAIRSRVVGDRVFVHPDGRPLPYAMVQWTFRRLVRTGAFATSPGQPRPRIHSLRHTFAVRALEACAGDRTRIARHQIALMTYLGHAHLESTYWYLQATPHLLRDIASCCETYGFKGAA